MEKRAKQKLLSQMKDEALLFINIQFAFLVRPGNEKEARQNHIQQQNVRHVVFVISKSLLDFYHKMEGSTHSDFRKNMMGHFRLKITKCRCVRGFQTLKVFVVIGERLEEKHLKSRL